MINQIGTAQPSRNTQAQSRDKYENLSRPLKNKFKEASEE